MNAKVLSVNPPIVRVSINGHNTAMMIDSGASANVVDLNQIGRYDIRKGIHLGEADVAGGGLDLWHVKNCEVKIDGIPVYQFLAADLKSVVENVYKATDIMIAGLLGTPAIIQAELGIRLSDGEITIGY